MGAMNNNSYYHTPSEMIEAAKREQHRCNTRQLKVLFSIALSLAFVLGHTDAFVVSNVHNSVRSSSLFSESEGLPQLPANLVNKNDFVIAIDVLKRDLGIETGADKVDESQKIFAIGKLQAKLPLSLVSGIRLADCETLTLISGLKQGVADETGIQPLDTIVAIRAGIDDEGGFGYEGQTSGVDLPGTAEVYTAAVNYAMANNLAEIELEVNRLVPMFASQEKLE